MRRLAIIWAVLVFLLSTTLGRADEGKICKVLPQFLDQKGRQSLSPSLYERDAYQFYLRRHPQERNALHVVVQWKAKGVDWGKIKLRAELRGLLTNSLQTVTLEQPVKKEGWFAPWSSFDIVGDDFKKFGELVAWRVTLLEGDKQLSQMESFLWSGVPVPVRMP